MAQKTAFEAKGRQHIAVKEFNVYLTLIYIHTQRFIAIGKANGKSSKFTIKNNCWFARDVTAAMLVVKNKSISLLWELNSIFM